ncbi:hypothetical protein EGU16_06100 [Acinetobacter baumannii]|nr:hypothetical protein EGU16_06100 [Acinetobacter baumannii]
MLVLLSSFKPDTKTSYGNGDRLNRGRNTVTKETASQMAALSSLPKSSKAEFYSKKRPIDGLFASFVKIIQVPTPDHRFGYGEIRIT